MHTRILDYLSPLAQENQFKIFYVKDQAIF